MQSPALAMVGMSVRLSVCHTLALCQNDAGYHEIFTDGQPKDSRLYSLSDIRFIQKFEMIHTDPHHHPQKHRLGTLVAGNIRFMRIFAWILWKEASNDSGAVAVSARHTEGAAIFSHFQQ